MDSPMPVPKDRYAPDEPSPTPPPPGIHPACEPEGGDPGE